MSMFTVDDFIAGQPEEYRATLEELRGVIRDAAPGAEELISYQVPSFKYHYMLVGFGVNKKYCSLYTMSPPLVKELKEEIGKAGATASGATVHFVPGKKLPAALIRKIVKLRMRQNEARIMVKK